MKSTTLILASALASVAVAQPHGHQHAAIHQKRDAAVVWVTDYDYVTETVQYTTTIWVSDGFVEPTSSAEIPTTSSETTSSVASSSTGVPAQFFEPNSVPATSSKTTFSSVYVAPTTSTSVYIAPSTEAAPIPTTTSTTPVSIVPTPAPTTSSSTQVAAAAVVEPTSTTTEAVAATVAPSSSSSGSSAASDSSSSSSYGAVTSGCTASSPCTGDMTYYTAGMGACGTVNDGNVERVVALPHGLMGTQSNGNPYCGQTITIRCAATGKHTTATVVDKCMGCVGDSIDLSNAAFLELDSLGVGRTTADWWFN